MDNCLYIFHCRNFGIENSNRTELDGVTTMANSTIVKEEIEIKDEVFDDSVIGEATKSNVTCDISPSKSSPHLNNSANMALQMISTEQNNKNFSLGFDNNVYGAFSTETIGSKTLIVFRRLPDSNPPQTASRKVKIPKISHRATGNRSKKVRNLHENNNCSIPSVYQCDACPYQTEIKSTLSKHIRRKHGVKLERLIRTNIGKTLQNDQFTLICLKCKISMESNSMFNCTSCKAKCLLECSQCHRTFSNHQRFDYHLQALCNPSGHFHCPQCDFRSRFMKNTRRHILNVHSELNIDLTTVKWKIVPRDENDVNKLIHTCLTCGLSFHTSKQLNSHRQSSQHQRKLATFKARSETQMKKHNKKVHFDTSANISSTRSDETEAKCNPRKNMLYIPGKKKNELNLIACQNCDKLFVQDSEFSKHLKCCEKKISLTRLQINNKP